MIKKLQRKFIMITMGSLLAVMLLLVGSINLIYYYNMENRLKGAIQILADNQGKFPEFRKDNPPNEEHKFGFIMNEETKFVTRYFTANVGSDGTINNYDTGHVKAVTSDNVADYVQKVMNSGKKSGFIGNYRYAVINQTDGSMIIFIDSSLQLQNARLILAISGIVSLVTLVLMFILVTVFSRKAIKPIIESTEKQKLFITDAGHEIKTPLAIISANADVLELMNGESEWITSIRNQTTRLDKLVKNLLTLSKMEEGTIKISFAEFDLSETVSKIASPFSAVADNNKKTFEMNIQPGIRLFGDQGSMEQLVSTLVDNAMKYSDEEGSIRLTLSSLKKGIKLEVYNTTDEIETDHLDKLFDRFYRSDSSRSRETGGYGIGLSIAKSIVEAHHGKISVRSEDGRSIYFTVII